MVSSGLGLTLALTHHYKTWLESNVDWYHLSESSMSSAQQDIPLPNKNDDSEEKMACLGVAGIFGRKSKELIKKSERNNKFLFYGSQATHLSFCISLSLPSGYPYTDQFYN